MFCFPFANTRCYGSPSLVFYAHAQDDWVAVSGKRKPGRPHRSSRSMTTHRKTHNGGTSAFMFKLHVAYAITEHGGRVHELHDHAIITAVHRQSISAMYP